MGWPVRRNCKSGVFGNVEKTAWGALSHIWRAITDVEGIPRSQRFQVPREVLAELVRFVGLAPFAFTNFRSDFDEKVTVSDASTFGGAFVSRGAWPRMD